MKVAIVEDGRSQAEFGKALLESMGHGVEVFLDGKSFMACPRRREFDLYLLDIELPDTSGDRILAWIRSEIGWRPLVMFLTASSEEETVVRMLQLGADDYMIKPIRFKEMISRVEVLYRRSPHLHVCQQIALGALVLDLEARTITCAGNPIEVTQREFDLAVFFASNIGRVLSREDLLQRVWKTSPDIDTRTIDTHVSRLRKKLGLFEGSGLWLQSIYGKGYRLDCVTTAQGS